MVKDAELQSVLKRPPKLRQQCVAQADWYVGRIWRHTCPQKPKEPPWAPVEPSQNPGSVDGGSSKLS